MNSWLLNPILVTLVTHLAQGTEIKLADCMEVSLGELGKDVSLDVAKGFDETISLETSQGGPHRLQVTHENRHPLQQSAAWGGGIVLEEDVPQGFRSYCPGTRGSSCCLWTECYFPSCSIRRWPVLQAFPNSFKISGIKHVCDNALSSILSGLPQILTSELVLFLISTHHFCDNRLLLDNFLMRETKPKIGHESWMIHNNLLIILVHWAKVEFIVS